VAAAALLPACHQNVTLSAVLTSADRVDLSWTSGAVAGFTVERSTSGGAFVPLASLPGSARAWTDSAPPGGAVLDYRLQVRGFDGSVHATAPTRVATPWAATYGAAGDEDALSLSVLPDGGLWISAEGFPLAWGSYDAWFLRLAPDGAILGQKAYGTPLGEWATYARPASNGDLLAVGACGWAPGNGDAWIVRLDRRWNPVWQRSFGGPRTDLALSIEPTRDGDFLVAGWTDSFGAGAEDLWILRLSGADGSIVWQRTYGGPASEWAPMIWVRETPDGGVAAAGATRSAGAGGSDLWALKLARDGSIAFPAGGSFRTLPSAASSLNTRASIVPLGASRRDPGFAVSAYPGSVTDTSVAPRRQAP
jgi:hypothetical protein